MLPLPVRPNFAASAGACLWKQQSRPDFLRKASNGCAARKAAGAWLFMNASATDRRWMSMLHEAPVIPWPSRDGSRVPFEVFTRADVFAREQEAIFRGPGLELRRPGGGDPAAERLQDDVRRRHADRRQPRRGRQPARLPEPMRPSRRHGAARRRAATLASTNASIISGAYNSRGDLVGVPYRRGVPGMGGYSADFDPKDHGLAKLRVASRKGVIFATFRSDTVALEEYLDEPLLAAIDRLFSRPIKVLGHMRQRVRGNWKLYSENTRDPYHAALLHGFHATFGLYRTNQKRKGGSDRARAHSTGVDLRRRLAPGRPVRQHRAGQVRRQLFPGRSFPAGRPARFQRRRDGADHQHFSLPGHPADHEYAGDAPHPAQGGGRVRALLDLLRLPRRRRADDRLPAQAGQSRRAGRPDLDGGQRGDRADPARHRARRPREFLPGVRRPARRPRQGSRRRGDDPGFLALLRRADGAVAGGRGG